MKKKKVKYWLHLKIIKSIEIKIKCAIIVSDTTNETSFFILMEYCFASHKPALYLTTLSNVTLLPFILNAYISKLNV